MFKRSIIPLSLLAAGLTFFVWTLVSPFWEALRTVSGVMQLIHKEYVDQEAVSYEQLTQSAIRGMIEGLDPYSSYMSLNEFKRFQGQTAQSYVGIGVEIEKVGDWVTVMKVFDGGPAFRAGIQAGDAIVAVDGDSMESRSVADVSAALLGEKGESVLVSLRRPGEPEPFERSLVRSDVEVASVQDIWLRDGIGHMRLTVFGEQTEKEFRQAEERLWQDGMKGLILDLRDNPGGLLSSAKGIAGLYLDPGATVVELRGREDHELQSYTASGELAGRDYPIVILVNAQSASGAEILAGVLQDADRAWLIGGQTHGKGSVQSVYRFERGDGMRQTTALYYLPSGRSIHEIGIEPDQVIEVEREERLRYLLQERHEGILNREAFEEAFGFLPDVEDLPLMAAVDWLKRSGA